MSRKIFLYAGHSVVNGVGTGAKGFIDEAVQAIELRNKIASYLNDYNVILDDNSESLTNVVKNLKKKVAKNDIVIDIHFNAASPTATGTEVFIPNTYSESELELATSLVTVISDTLNMRKRSGKLLSERKVEGVKIERESQHPTLAILSATDIDVSILLEICFVTNVYDVAIYQDKFNQLAENIANCIVSFLTRK